MGCCSSSSPTEDNPSDTVVTKTTKPTKAPKKDPPPVYHDTTTKQLFNKSLNIFVQSLDDGKNDSNAYTDTVNDITFIVTDKISNETKHFQCIRSLFALHCPSLKFGCVNNLQFNTFSTQRKT